MGLWGMRTADPQRAGIVMKTALAVSNGQELLPKLCCRECKLNSKTFGRSRGMAGPESQQTIRLLNLDIRRADTPYLLPALP
jgi:hypothetical protein